MQNRYQLLDIRENTDTRYFVANIKYLTANIVLVLKVF
jgi:hypothetical protein